MQPKHEKGISRKWRTKKEKSFACGIHVIVNLCVLYPFMCSFHYIISRERERMFGANLILLVKFFVSLICAEMEELKSWGQKMLSLTAGTAAGALYLGCWTVCGVVARWSGKKIAKLLPLPSCAEKELYGVRRGKVFVPNCALARLSTASPKKKKKRNLCKLMKIYLSAYENHLMFLPAVNIYSKKSRERERACKDWENISAQKFIKILHSPLWRSLSTEGLPPFLHTQKRKLFLRKEKYFLIVFRTDGEIYVPSVLLHRLIAKFAMAK